MSWRESLRSVGQLTHAGLWGAAQAAKGSLVLGQGYKSPVMWSQTLFILNCHCSSVLPFHGTEAGLLSGREGPLVLTYVRHSTLHCRQDSGAASSCCPVLPLPIVCPSAADTSGTLCLHLRMGFLVCLL